MLLKQFRSMSKTIILLRHGKVDMDTEVRIDSLALQAWVEEYDKASLSKESLPSQESIEAVHSAKYVFSSALKRANESAKLLKIQVNESNVLFNEADIPAVKVPFLKLRPKVWLIILRFLLLFRLGKMNDSFQLSQKRAKKAAESLTKQAEVSERVALIGHGGMNWLISKELLKRGWKPLGAASHKNWGLSVYTI